MQEICADNICEIDLKAGGGRVVQTEGFKEAYQELHDDGAQMMCGSTMGVWSGLSFYTGHPRNQQRCSLPPLSKIHTGEIKIGGGKNVNLSLEQNRS